MQALVEACRDGRLPATPAVVFSNAPDAEALARASAQAIPVESLDHRQFGSRREFDLAVVEKLRLYRPDLVVLAGYMRVVTPAFLDAFPERVINIHPALLPAFPGTHAVRQAWEYGAKVVGCTVHFVDAEVDHGPIILQRAIAADAASAEALAAKLLPVEHETLVEAVKLIATGRIRIVGRRVDVGA